MVFLGYQYGIKPYIDVGIVRQMHKYFIPFVIAFALFSYIYLCQAYEGKIDYQNADTFEYIYPYDGLLYTQATTLKALRRLWVLCHAPRSSLLVDQWMVLLEQGIMEFFYTIYARF
ncbi:MAG: hypothetical protein EZS28_011417 [Streblomastix strix]|uniref:Uncharacterized protein n=1 Tax=Streblomastix strix TaxID=222440 RepID=A0A5J4WDL1_9EUKA|nr:MAG: hypothetical protein EZS28_011417 [Streblomastix strix]